jgi:hypothetical protein
MPNKFNEFVTGSELDEVDDMHNLAVYTSNDDPKAMIKLISWMFGEKL